MIVKELVALLGIKTDKKGFDDAEKGMGKVIKIAKAAAAAFAALKVVQFAKAIITETAAAGDAFDKMARRTGIAADDLQGLGHAAELSGAKLGDIETSMKRLQSAQVEASEGVSTYSDEFKRLGVEVKDSEGQFKDTTELLLEVSDSIGGLGSQAEQTQVLMKLFGRSGVNLLPMLKEGSEGIREMMGEMKALGGLMDEDLIKSSADFVDNQRRMDVAMMGIKNTITKEVLPAINGLTDSFIDWWKANGQIIRQHMGTVFGGIGRVIMANVRFFGRLVRIVFDFVSNLSPLTKKIAGVALGIKALGFIISKGPLGKILLLIAAVGLLIEDFETWRKGGKSVIGDIMGWLGDLLGMDLSFEQWSQDMTLFGNLVRGVWDDISSVFIDNVTLIAEGLANNFMFMTDIVDSFASFFTDVWDDPAAANLQFYEDMSTAASSWYERFQELFGGVIEWFELSVITPIANMFSNLWSGVTAEIDRVFERIKSIGKTVNSLFGFGGGESSGDTSSTGAVQEGEKSGGATPSAGASNLAGPRTINSRGGNSSMVNASKTTIQVDIKASPGMDPKQIGQEVSKQVSQQMDRQNRAAMRAFTRSASGA